MAKREFMRVSVAAEYVGLSQQTLRRWDRAGRLARGEAAGVQPQLLPSLRLGGVLAGLPPRRGGDRKGLDLATANANVEANELLRQPQRGARGA